MAGNQKSNAKYTSEVGEGDFYAAMGPDFFIMFGTLLERCGGASAANSTGCANDQ